MSIESVYGELLGRSPDEGAYGTYAGFSDDQIRGAILGSEEYANRQRPSQPQQQQQQSSGGGNNIDSLYQQYLKRSPDEGAYRTYAGFNDEQIRNAILGSQEYANRQSGGRSAGMSSLLAPSNTPAPAAPYTPGPSYGEYNFEMTGKPSDVELATNPDMANAWYRFSGTSPAPAITWATAPDAVTTSPKGISFYKDYGLEKPFSTTDIQSTVDPKSIRYGYGNTPYAGVKSNVAGLESGGEYVIDPKTNKFILDQSGNPIPVPQEPYKQSGFGNIMENYLFPAFVAAAAFPVLGGLGGQAFGGLGFGGEAALGTTFEGLTPLQQALYSGGGTIADTTALTPAANAILSGSTSAIPGATSTLGTLGQIGSGYAGFGLNPAIQTGGQFAYQGVGLNPAITGYSGVGLNPTIPGITSGLATNAGALALASGVPITPDIFGGSGGLTAEQAYKLDSALTAASATPTPSLLDKLSPGALSTAALATTALKTLTGTPTTTTPTTTGTPSTYAPKGQVGYDPLLSLLAPRLIPRNQYSLLG